ncbi:MAG TPA: hypothetical protein VKE93_05630, partial [Candidatus Angelobacter sp.]|nr:hypothetical protein [Candidatus Angelobacter sp.]
MKARRSAQIVALISILALCLIWTSAAAQTTNATLSGVVRDSSGALVPQVKVTLRNTSKGISRATST